MSSEEFKKECKKLFQETKDLFATVEPKCCGLAFLETNQVPLIKGGSAVTDTDERYIEYDITLVIGKINFRLNAEGQIIDKQGVPIFCPEPLLLLIREIRKRIGIRKTEIQAKKDCSF